jgi:hypothetical protein
MNIEKYKYTHVLPTNSVYQLRPGYPRIKRPEQYRLAQSIIATHKLNPNETYHRRVQAFLPGGKSINILERIQAIEKLQKKSVEIQSRRAHEEKAFLSQIREVKGKITSKFTEQKKKQDESEKTKNNAERKKLINEVLKIKNNVTQIIEKGFNRDKLEKIVKQENQLKRAINGFYYGKLENHLIYGNSNIASKKRSKLISALMIPLRDNQRTILNNSHETMRNTPRANKMREVSIHARSNKYKSKLKLEATNLGKYKLPLKLNHNSGKRKTLAEIRKEYRLMKERESGMNTNEIRVGKDANKKRVGKDANKKRVGKDANTKRVGKDANTNKGKPPNAEAKTTPTEEEMLYEHIMEKDV